MFNNLISQAGQMQLHGAPNDMLQAMAGVACVIFGPIIQALYNFLAKRRIMHAMVQLSACLGSLMAMALSPVSRDPHLVIVDAVIAGVMGAYSVLFWWKFQKYDAVDRELNDLADQERESDVASTQEDTKERT